jgi:hypothetical protein
VDKIEEQVLWVDKIEEKLSEWRSSLVNEVNLNDLFARSTVAHKWQVTYQTLLVRELSLWRMEDLLSQAMILQKLGHVLGARILIRSGFETLATLIFLNSRINAVVLGNIPFLKFREVIGKLLFGSKLIEENHDPIHIMDAIKKSNKKYPGILKSYNSLSESAHPNFDGMAMGYSQSFEKERTTKFSNRFNTLFFGSNITLAGTCIEVFELEYNEGYQKAMTSLEEWLIENDEILIAEKSDLSP